MTTDTASVYCTFAGAVYKQFLQRRYGIQSCPAGDELAGAIMDKQMADHKKIQDQTPVIPTIPNL